MPPGVWKKCFFRVKQSILAKKATTMDKEPEIIDAEVIETNGASNLQKGIAD